MSNLVLVLRFLSLLPVAAPMVLPVSGRCGGSRTGARQSGGSRAPLVANLAAVGLYFPSLLVFSGNPSRSTALLLASSGCLLAVGGAALVLRSRAELGAAWSLAPKADEGTGLVTTGPYRHVRHPIYLGLALITLGQAIAFDSRPALGLVLLGIIPTFAWRACAEERVLDRTFGDRYAVYRKRTNRIFPYLF